MSHEPPDPIQPVDRTPRAAAVDVEAEVEAALDRSARERIATSTQEFVSERDALEDAWDGAPERGARDEGW